ncbi:MAG: hypothetical protein ACREPQ_09300 [Rhodanobacter sp.]
MWRALRGWPRLACMAGIVLALLSLTVWIDVLGIAVGLSAMLASWMLALAVQPYLALFIGTPTTDPTSPKPCGSDFSRDALDSFDPQTSRLKPLPQGDRR